MNFLDTSFDIIRTLFAQGFSNLVGTLWIAAGIFFVLDLGLLVIDLKWGLADEEKEIVKRILMILFFVFMMTFYTPVMKSLGNLFSRTGLIAGGSADIYNGGMPRPGALLARGIAQAAPVLKKAESYGINIMASIPYWICWAVMMGSYIIMTLIFIMVYIEFYAIIGAGSVILPFGLFKATKRYIETFFGFVIGQGIKLLLLNYAVAVIGRAQNTQRYLLGEDLSIDQVLVTVTISLLFLFIVKLIPQLASGFTSGSPTMSSPNILSSMATLAAVGFGLKKMGQAGAAGAKGAAMGGLKIAGGGAKALSAGKAAYNAQRDLGQMMGVKHSKRTALQAGVIAADKSLGNSLKKSFISGGKGFVNRMLFNDKTPAAGSLEDIGDVGSFFKNRKAQGHYSGENYGKSFTRPMNNKIRNELTGGSLRDTEQMKKESLAYQNMELSKLKNK